MSPDASIAPESLRDAVRLSVEHLSTPGPPAAKSARLSSLLRPFSSSPLVQRMMFHLALADGSAGRCRFAAEVLTGEDARWLAFLLAQNALPSATRAWQKRRLEALLAEQHSLPATLGERLVHSIRVTAEGVLDGARLRDPARSDVAVGAAVDSTTWLQKFVDSLSERPLGMHRDVLLVDVDVDAPEDVVAAVLTACQILPVTAATIFPSIDQCSTAISATSSSGLPSRSLHAVRSDEGNYQVIDAGGAALLDVIQIDDLCAGSEEELVTLAVIHGALDLLCDPVLRSFRGLVLEALRKEHRPQLPLYSDTRGFTRLAHFHAAGRAAAELRESLAGHLLEAGFAAEALALLHDIPARLEGKYYRARMQRAQFAVGNFAEAAGFAASDRITQEATAAASLLDALDVVSAGPKEHVELRPGKVLTILHASAPEQSGGYAVRAQSLLAHLASSVDDHVAYTRPGFPEESNSLAPGEIADVDFEGVRYRRLGTQRARKAGQFQYMLESLEHYCNVIRRERPSVVHLRSTYVSALPGLIAAKHFGIPTVYEVSGMWELVYEADHSPRKEVLRAQTVRLENAVLDQADTVATITEAMARIIAGRVTTKAPVQIVPNAVDVEVFADAERDTALLQSLAWGDDTPVLGYIGSFVGYEGLDVYLRALAELRKRGIAFYGLFVGDGAAASALYSLASSLDLGPEHLTFTGRVPHEQVAKYAAIVDVFAYPRLLTPATEAVSPLKPFEAMAAGKPVIVSDVPALAEIVNHGERGHVVASGSSSALADALEAVITNRESTVATRTAAREWVRRERSWDAVGDSFTGLITSLLH